ncbi:MAG: adenylate kinase [Candidatus Omnitrophica bacterium]|nr:adenylate kinase [Candidatus Omnitrophota bacterium]
MRIVLLGPPGAGKGTLANLIKGKFAIPHISTGDILREEMKAESALGKKIKGYVESGALVPDEIIIQIIENRLTEKGAPREGYMLDGFPRTTAQATALDAILKKIGQPIESAIYMETTLPMIVSRLTGRRVCRECGAVFHMTNRPSKKGNVCDSCDGELYQRADDNEETIRKRMDVYLTSTTPIIEYYQKQEKLLKVDGNKESEDLLQELSDEFNENKAAHRD